MLQHPLLTIAIQAARSAGRLLLQFMDQLDRVTIQKKSVNDLVSAVDLMAEQAIIQQIQKAYPEHSILAEESGFTAGKNKDICWIVDPLDGSANYIHTFPQFAISIAVRQRGQLQVAVVYDPILQELFTAVRGGGAYLNDRRIRVSGCKQFSAALLGTGFPFKDKQQLQPYLTVFASIFLAASDVRRAGSAALDLAYTAAGRLDGFWEGGLAEWDIAAGTLLIQEAGGLVTDFQGGDTYLSSGQITAGSPAVHSVLQDFTKDLMRSP